MRNRRASERILAAICGAALAALLGCSWKDEAGERAAPDGEDTGVEKEFSLSERSQKELLRLARRALEVAAATGAIGEAAAERVARKVTERYEPTQELKQKRGVFVTLEKDGRLRGCIGIFRGDKELYLLVPEFAVHAGFMDPRFAPLAAGELPRVKIKISVLSPLRRASPEEVTVGKHGIYVRRGFRSGCYLPEVAVDHHMGREEFLSSCCAGKAGLAADAWKDEDTELFVFTTFRFEEK